MHNGIFHPPACQNLYYQDGKQEISLEWPNNYCSSCKTLYSTYLVDPLVSNSVTYTYNANSLSDSNCS